MINRAANQGTFARSMMLEYLEPYEETAFIQRTVEEMLFKGYYVDFMEDFAKFLGYQLLPNNMFGLYYAVRKANKSMQILISQYYISKFT